MNALEKQAMNACDQLKLYIEQHSIPAECIHELKVVDIGGGKSFCELFGMWTNCREVKHCTFEEKIIKRKDA